jgi:diguanylate cyclase (GGDEF)-like protein
LLNCVRATDIVGRWGGDEFVVLLPKTVVAKATQVLERARIMVAESVVAIGDVVVKTTVSIGAVAVTGEDSRVNLLQRADRQLYIAKKNSRNCCSVR